MRTRAKAVGMTPERKPRVREGEGGRTSEGQGISESEESSTASERMECPLLLVCFFLSFFLCSQVNLYALTRSPVL